MTMKVFKFLQENTMSREYNLYEEMILQLMIYNSRNNIPNMDSTHIFNENGHNCEIKILQVVAYIDSIIVHYRLFDSFNYTTELYNMELTFIDYNRLINETI